MNELTALPAEKTDLEKCVDLYYTVQKKKRIGGVARVNEPARGQYLKVDSDFDLAQPRTVSSMTPHKNFANFAALKWVSG